ncbi:hypothetical protein LY78DRAFT_660325 [Colletotrichum sublineola]|nr:hypothetical protein LY78DRAFT_660325 [Colletotrichum sublineola]
MMPAFIRTMRRCTATLPCHIPALHSHTVKLRHNRKSHHTLSLFCLALTPVPARRVKSTKKYRKYWSASGYLEYMK